MFSKRARKPAARTSDRWQLTRCGFLYERILIGDLKPAPCRRRNMPSLAELREQIRLARVERQRLAKKIADTSINANQKRAVVHQYNIIVGNLKGMASELEGEIKASKRAIADRGSGR
jgi:hypothetical protein